MKDQKNIAEFISEIKNEEVKKACQEILQESDTSSPNKVKRSELLAKDETDAILSIGTWGDSAKLIREYITKKTK